MQHEITTDLISTTQARLHDLGFYDLRVDGLMGDGTVNAITRFKEVNGLRARPKIGPVTQSLLWSEDAKRMPNVVVEEAFSGIATIERASDWLGVREVKGKGDNPTIMGWAQDLDIWYPGDDTPWCGLFAADVNHYANPNEPQNFNRLGARAWLEWGKDAGSAFDHPPLGGTVVFWRTHKTNSWHGHVAPAITGVSGDGMHIRCIGGNQSDEVNERWFPVDRVLGYRIAHGLDNIPAPVAKVGRLSLRES